MKKSIIIMLAGLFIVPIVALAMPVTSANATDTTTVAADLDNNGIDDVTDAETKNAACSAGNSIVAGADCAKSADQSTSLFGKGGIFQIITNTALFIIGALSVIMLIYGGIRYTISMGDAKNVEAAKNTIMYAIIGIVVALLAAAIVNFVLGALIK